MKKPKRMLVIFIAMAAVGANLELISRALPSDLVPTPGACPPAEPTVVAANFICRQGLMTGSLAGWTSLWMWLVYGFAGVVLGSFNEKHSVVRRWPMALQALLGCVFATLLELGSGLILNKVLRFQAWDYTGKLLEYQGQICLRSAALFFFVAPLAFWLDDAIRFIGGYHKTPPLKLHFYYLKMLDFKFKKEERQAAA